MIEMLILADVKNCGLPPPATTDPFDISNQNKKI